MDAAAEQDECGRIHSSALETGVLNLTCCLLEDRRELDQGHATFLHPYLRLFNRGIKGMSAPFGGLRQFRHGIHPQNVGSLHPDRAPTVLSLLNQTAQL